MVVELNISKDEELRNAVKDMVKGQVTALARESITEILRGEIGKKVAAHQDFIERMIKEVIQKWFNSMDAKVFLRKTVDQAFENHINTAIGEMLVNRDWNPVIKDLAQRRFTQMVESLKEVK